MKDKAEKTISIEPVRCLECGRFWIETSEHWRMYLSAEEPPRPLTYCPDCARREFD
jgi:hypothetical protein